MLTCNLGRVSRPRSKTDACRPGAPSPNHPLPCGHLLRVVYYILYFFCSHTFSFFHKSSIPLRRSAFLCIHECSPTIKDSLASFAAVVGLISTVHRTQLIIDNHREYHCYFLGFQQPNCFLQSHLNIESLSSQVGHKAGALLFNALPQGSIDQCRFRNRTLQCREETDSILTEAMSSKLLSRD